MAIPEYGLIGYPLTHSFSPAYFRKRFEAAGIDAAYHAFELRAIEQLPSLLQERPQLRGLNVTIPYKEAVIPYLDELDEVAADIGAVNCIHITDGGLKGYNTDAAGFEQSLRPLLQPGHRKALVLGTGGSSKAVTYTLDKLGIVYMPVSREEGKDRLSYASLKPELVREHTLIINTTPLGMYPDTDRAPALPYEALTERHLLYDLIYNPEETLFLKRGRERGATTANGMKMLYLQAEESWRIWNGTNQQA